MPEWCKVKWSVSCMPGFPSSSSSTAPQVRCSPCSFRPICAHLTFRSGQCCLLITLHWSHWSHTCMLTQNFPRWYMCAADVLRSIACCCGQTSHDQQPVCYMLCTMTLLLLRVSSLSLTACSSHAACQQHTLHSVKHTQVCTVTSVWQA